MLIWECVKAGYDLARETVRECTRFMAHEARQIRADRRHEEKVAREWERSEAKRKHDTVRQKALEDRVKWAEQGRVFEAGGMRFKLVFKHKDRYGRALTPETKIEILKD